MQKECSDFLLRPWLSTSETNTVVYLGIKCIKLLLNGGENFFYIPCFQLFGSTLLATIEHLSLNSVSRPTYCMCETSLEISAYMHSSDVLNEAQSNVQQWIYIYSKRFCIVLYFSVKEMGQNRPLYITIKLV